MYYLLLILFISQSLFVILLLDSHNSHLYSYPSRNVIPLTIRTTERRKWDCFHELYEEYVQFYQHLKKGSCSTPFFLYPLSQGYYYINHGSASLKENLIRISSKKNCSSSPIVRRYSKYLISNTTVQLIQHND